MTNTNSPVPQSRGTTTGNNTPRKEASSPETPSQRLRDLAKDPKLARLVAANPGTPPDLLLELSHSETKAVRKACTSNANTPVEALLKLGCQFPEQLMENPVFDLLLLGHPGLFEELPTSTLNSLIKRDQVPVELIRWAWKHRGESTLHSLLMNSNTPVDVVEELCKHKDPEVRIAAELHCARTLPAWAQDVNPERLLAEHPRFSNHFSLHPTPKWLERHSCNIATFAGGTLIDHFIKASPSSIRNNFAIHAHCPNTLARLSSDDSGEVRTSVAYNWNTSSKILQSLANDEEKEVRLTVAQNDRASSRTLSALARDEWHCVREAVARHVNVSADTLDAMAKDRYKKVRFWVAANKCASSTALQVLIRDSDKQVSALAALGSDTTKDLSSLLDEKNTGLRLALAKSSSTRNAILSFLACDTDKSVRWHVASNTNTPADALSLLAPDEHSPVRRKVAGNKSTPVETLRSLMQDPEVISDLAGNTSLPQDLLVELAEHSSPFVRRSVAGNTAAPLDILVKLANDPVDDVRRSIVANESTPKATIYDLVIHDADLCKYCASNPNTPASILRQIAQKDEYMRYLVFAENAKATNKLKSEIRDMALEEICQDACKGFSASPSRRFLFTIPQCPASILAKNFRSRCWLERYAIAGNPSTPEAVLQRMAQEGNQLVRRAAAGNLARHQSPNDASMKAETACET